MAKVALSIAFLSSVLLSSSAWAVPQGASCRLGTRAKARAAQTTLTCSLYQDPWQDCDEDPWQISLVRAPEETFPDPWQDSADPWQPFVATSSPSPPASAQTRDAEDLWQSSTRLAAKGAHNSTARDSFEDPWQPVFLDPWQAGEDPWQ